MGGRSTNAVIGKKIGESLEVDSLESLLKLIEDLKIGIPTVTKHDEQEIVIALDECMVSSCMEPIGE